MPGTYTPDSIAPLSFAANPRKKPGRRRVYPAPAWSARFYVRINPPDVHLFRCFLEAQDNLGIMSVVDRWGAILQVRCSPHQEKECRAFVTALEQKLSCKVLDLECKDLAGNEHRTSMPL